jgi:hypothetical protein
MTYLGFPMSYKKLTMVDWESMVGMVGHLVEPWQHRFTSSVARLILTNSSLSSLPIFCMWFFFEQGCPEG